MGRGGCVKNTDPKGQKQEMKEIWKEERLRLAEAEAAEAEVAQLAHTPPARLVAHHATHVLLLHASAHHAGADAPGAGPSHAACDHQAAVCCVVIVGVSY